jgi:hypothetical protein
LDHLTLFLYYTISFKVNNDEDEVGKTINLFWTEFEDFQAKTGPYENREYIFRNHADINEERVYIWHKKETLRYTKHFGKFACRVTSKILGIGSAERSWGDVKHLKTNQRSHMSADRISTDFTKKGRSRYFYKSLEVLERR